MGDCVSKQGDAKAGAKDADAPYEKSPVNEGIEANGKAHEEAVTPENVKLTESADAKDPIEDIDNHVEGSERVVTKSVTRTTVVKSVIGGGEEAKEEAETVVTTACTGETGEVQTTVVVTKETKEGDEVKTETQVVEGEAPGDLLAEAEATLQERMEASMSRLVSQLPEGVTVSPEAIQDALKSAEVSGVKTTQVTKTTTTVIGDEEETTKDVTRTVEHYEGTAAEPVVTSTVTEHFTEDGAAEETPAEDEASSEAAAVEADSDNKADIEVSGEFSTSAAAELSVSGDGAAIEVH